MAEWFLSPDLNQKLYIWFLKICSWTDSANTTFHMRIRTQGIPHTYPSEYTGFQENTWPWIHTIMKTKRTVFVMMIYSGNELPLFGKALRNKNEASLILSPHPQPKN